MLAKGLDVEVLDAVFFLRVSEGIIRCLNSISEVEACLAVKLHSELSRFVVRIRDIVSFVWLNSTTLFHRVESFLCKIMCFWA